MTLDPVSSGDPHVPAHNLERDAINALRVDVDQKIPAPALGLGLGAILRWDGNNWVPSKMRLFEGNGSPEGVISAPVGSRYVDATAAGGNSEWFKQSGTGNTGWTPQNTGIGWTNYTLGSGWAHVAGKPAQVSMVNGVCYHRGFVRRTSGTSTAVGSIPTTMAPPLGLTTMIRSGGDWLGWVIASNGNIVISGAVDSNVDINVGTASGVPYRIV